MRILSSTAAPSADAESRRVVIRTAKETRVGVLSGAAGRRSLTLPDRARVVLPMDLPALVARDGSVVVQVGDPGDLAHPKITNLYWVNLGGKLLRNLEKYFAGRALAACSEDGYVAVVGRRLDGGGSDVLSLFSPKGDLVWERPVGNGRAIHADPVVAAQGRRVAAITTDAGNPLREHRVLIVDERGSDLGSIGRLDSGSFVALQLGVIWSH